MKYRTAGIFAGLLGTGVFLSLTVSRAFAGGGSAFALIPMPMKAQRQRGQFTLKPQARILVDAVARQTGGFLAERLRKSTGFEFNLEETSDSAPAKGDILLTTEDAQANLGPEGYTLSVTPDSVVIRATASAGLFYGMQTLLQLFPPNIFSREAVQGCDWTAPCVRIQDKPRFKWRGFMLDCARHFFTKQEVERVLDAMAMHKLNMFHWHLTDDQGWRIEIKEYPLLTKVGAWRHSIGFGLGPKSSTAYGPDGRYGGFYTQDDIRQIVAYAQARHITIVPEIEMPGHCSAALSAYPQYSCFGGPYNTDMRGKISEGAYCAGKDQTFEFLENVLSEVIDLFPGKYIHIGGDEVKKQNWSRCPLDQARMKEEGLKTERDLQGYFIRRIEKFLNSKGRTLIGWSEILEGGLAKNAVVMDWIGGAIPSAREGHDVVMTPTSNCYFDYYQSTNHTTEPRAIGGYLPLSKVYSFEPIPAGLEPRYQSHVLGAQANLWTEYVPNLKHAEYMMFPRLAALAEVAWSPKSARNYASFLRRLKTHEQRLDQLGINYRKLRPE